MGQRDFKTTRGVMKLNIVEQKKADNTGFVLYNVFPLNNGSDIRGNMLRLTK